MPALRAYHRSMKIPLVLSSSSLLLLLLLLLWLLLLVLLLLLLSSPLSVSCQRQETLVLLPLSISLFLSSYTSLLCAPQVVVSASCGLEGHRILPYKPLLDAAIEQAVSKVCIQIVRPPSPTFSHFLHSFFPRRIANMFSSLHLLSTTPYQFIFSTQPSTCIIFQRSVGPKAHLISGRDVEWDVAHAVQGAAPCVSVDANHPLYILYTSGTTGAVAFA